MTDSITDRIKQYLDGNDVEYRLISHAPAASAEEYHAVMGTRYEQQAKAVLIRLKRPGQKTFAVVALQAQKRVDLDRVRALLKTKDVRLATIDQLVESTGCQFGELPPFGKLFGLDLLFDTALQSEDQIYFNAGALTTSISMSPRDIVDLEQPIAY